MKLTQAYPVAPDQPFVVDRFRAEDAQGVANLFLHVYGPDYPMERYYDPVWLAQANAAGEVYSAVARTPSGDIVSHMAVYRSAPVNPALYEIGIGLTLASYRGAHASSRIIQFLADLLPTLPLEGAYGEAVTNHTVTQRFTQEVNGFDCAIELDLMPAQTYAAENSAPGRVSCVLSFIPLKDAPQRLYVPERHLAAARFMLAPALQPRHIEPARGRATAGRTDIRTQIIPFASVSRCQLVAYGADLEPTLADMEQQAAAAGCTTRQVFLNLADPAVGQAADWLRTQGYSLGGFAPRWFGSDGLLLHKLMHTPDFTPIKLWDPRTTELLALVATDWREVTEAVGLAPTQPQAAPR